MNDIVVFYLCRQHDKRNTARFRILLHLPATFETVFHRHHDITDDQVRHLFHCRIDSLLPVGCHQQVIFIAEEHFQIQADILMIFYNQYRLFSSARYRRCYFFGRQCLRKKWQLLILLHGSILYCQILFLCFCRFGFRLCYFRQFFRIGKLNIRIVFKDISVCRKIDRDLRPLSFGTFKSNRSVMGFDHLLHDGESHLRSRHITFRSFILAHQLFSGSYLFFSVIFYYQADIMHIVIYDLTNR